MSKIFIWERVDYATLSYHDEGGIAVVADDLDDARRVLSGMVPTNCGAFSEDPTRTFDLSGNHDRCTFVFPDAGCC